MEDGATAAGQALAQPDAMPRSSDALLLGVWREACRHIEIGESAEKIAALLAKQMPIAQLVVRRVDAERSCIETVARGWTDRRLDATAGRSGRSCRQMGLLLDWCRRGQIVHFGSLPAAPPELREAIEPMSEGDLMAGPLRDDHGPCGILLLLAARGRCFHEPHEHIAQALLEPFSTALENDRRLREMAAIRSAAEADKTSLLAKLGRKKIDDEVVVGSQSGLRGVMERVGLVARSDVPVLILGETGTGKEVVARLIHTHSPRAAGPFLRVNCGAIPPELIDSQLFGHERGAFTGATERRQGWFERASGGTLLLDEIGELPLVAQVRLLRILQDGWLERVGGNHPIHVDVRIVAATHRDLATMVAEGRFREDLWYRIATFPIPLPPLRERRQDIAELARHFARRAATRFVLPLVLPSDEDIELLTAYPWPGNVRELGAVIDRAAILGAGKRLDVAHALGVSAVPVPTALAVERGVMRPAEPTPRILPLDSLVKQHIESALSATRGQIEGPRGAAALLDINPHTLRARMRKMRIDWNRFRSA